jgi:hypothetical protein
MFKIKSLNDNKIVASDEDSFRAWWSQDLTIKKLQLEGLVKSEELLETPEMDNQQPSFIGR